MTNLASLPTLTAEELAELTAIDAMKPLTRLNYKHQLLARYIAKGYALEQASMLSGYSLHGARMVERDPSFQDLVKYYAGELEEYKEMLIVKLQAVSMEAVDELLERFSRDELREKMSIGQLEALIKLGSDRLGLAPASSRQEIDVNINIADKLETARKRHLALTAKPVIDVTPNEA